MATNVTVLKNVDLIDGIQTHPQKNSLVIFDDQLIIYAGPMSLDVLKQYPNSKVYDLDEQTLMPGMIDTHVHLTLAGEASYLHTLITENAQLTVIKGVERAKKALRSGFTTLRCLGEKGPIDVAIRAAIEQGIIQGPTIVASGKAITITGGHGDMFPGDIKIDGIAAIADGPDLIRKIVREQLKLGVDNIKLMATGGGMSPGPGTISQLTIEEMKVAIQEAEKYGKTTAAHAIGREGILNALKAGVRTLEHGTFIDKEGIELLKKNQAYLVPTLSAFKTLTYGKAGGVPEDHLAKVKHYQTAHIKNLRHALDAGVQVITGTDAGTPFNYHGENAYELACLTEVGMTEMEAIHAATRVAAEALLLNDRGTIEPGKLADLLVVNGNPLSDIKILQDVEKITHVFNKGQLV